MPAMIYFHFIHKASEAADIWNKYEAPVGHRWEKLGAKTIRI